MDPFRKSCPSVGAIRGETRKKIKVVPGLTLTFFMQKPNVEGSKLEQVDRQVALQVHQIKAEDSTKISGCIRYYIAYIRASNEKRKKSSGKPKFHLLDIR